MQLFKKSTDLRIKIERIFSSTCHQQKAGSERVCVGVDQQKQLNG